MQVLADAAIKASQEKELQVVIAMLKAEPEKIMLVKAVLEKQSAFPSVAPEAFPRGARNLMDIPLKHCKKIMCSVLHLREGQLVNMPRARADITHIFETYWIRYILYHVSK